MSEKKTPRTYGDRIRGVHKSTLEKAWRNLFESEKETGGKLHKDSYHSTNNDSIMRFICWQLIGALIGLIIVIIFR